MKIEVADFAAVAGDYAHYMVMHGVMKKQGQGNKRSWKDRFFVQLFNLLFYYDYESAPPEGEDLDPDKLVGVICLEGCTVTKIEVPAGVSGGAGLVLTTASNRIYTLVAQSVEERDQWAESVDERGHFLVAAGLRRASELTAGLSAEATSSSEDALGGPPAAAVCCPKGTVSTLVDRRAAEEEANAAKRAADDAERAAERDQLAKLRTENEELTKKVKEFSEKQTQLFEAKLTMKSQLGDIREELGIKNKELAELQLATEELRRENADLKASAELRSEARPMYERGSSGDGGRRLFLGCW